MPVSYQIDHDARRVTLIWHPPLELTEIFDAVERQAREGGWQYGTLHDARAVRQSDRSRIKPSLDMVERLSQTYGPRGPVAFVSSRETLKTAQAYAILGDREGHVTQVFWDRADADLWLREQLLSHR